MKLAFRLLIAASAVVAAVPLLRPVHAREAFGTASVRAVDPDSPQAHTRAGQVIVQFRADVDEREAARLTREAGAARARRSAFGNRYLVTLDAGFTAEDALARLAQAPEVEYAEANGRLHAFFTD